MHKNQIIMLWKLNNANIIEKRKGKIWKYERNSYLQEI